MSTNDQPSDADPRLEWLLRKAVEHPAKYGDLSPDSVQKKFASMRESVKPYEDTPLPPKISSPIRWTPVNAPLPAIDDENPVLSMESNRRDSAAIVATQPATRRSSAETSIDTPLRASVFLPSQNQYMVPESLPQWHTDIKDNGLEMKKLLKHKPQALASLDTLKICIRKCEATPGARLFDELRNHIHKAEIILEVNLLILKKSKILTPEYGLPRIFNEGQTVDFPWDIKVDAYQLFCRWHSGNLSVDLLRGITKSKGNNRGGDRIARDYKSKQSARYYGEGHLIPGQWWPTQLCTVRDGAHGSSQGGIFGVKGKGAYSIVLSGGNSYHDKDEGDTIEYSGTEGKDHTPTDVTQHLIESCDTVKQPVRVLRSSNLNINNPYRPIRGFRYDGLYEVMSYIVTNSEKAMYRFRLERCKGQKPIRYEDNAARRPTKFEIEAYNKLRY